MSGMRTTLDLPDPIFRDLKSRAAQEGVKLKDLVQEYIVAGLRGSYSPSVVRSPLPIFRQSSGAKNPVLSNAELQTILDEEDAR